ncbi:MAG: c-type cytochrome biogenesis protein CcsB [Actinomycetota bacterium]
MTIDQWTSVSRAAFTAALVAYLVSMLLYFHFLAFRRKTVWKVAIALASIGLVSHILAVVARGMAAERVPWGNMYEYSSLLALLVVAGYLFIVELRYRVHTLGGFVLGFAILTMAVAAMFFYRGPAPLVPALNSYWIKIHVVAAITGSALFALGSGVFTPLYLWQSRRERRRDERQRAEAAELGARSPAPIMGGSLDDDPPGYEAGADEPAAGPSRHGLLPPAEVLDRLAYRTIAFAFPIWTFAVIAGAIWAERAWGRYWGWDPKETWSFITWVVFAGYLHARATAGWKGRKAAVVALVGFASLLVTYYVVNIWVVGLHSYKGF